MNFPALPDWVSIFPSLSGGFMYELLYITGSGLSCGLVFNVKVVSVMLYSENLVYISPL